MEPTIGEHLARIRRQSTLTQEQLAERAGVSVETIRKLEQGERQGARTATLNKLARALGVPTSALFGNAARAAADREPDARPLSLVGVRRALTPVAGLDGVPLEAATGGRPPTLADVRRAVADANATYHANDYAVALAALPDLLGEARTLVDALDGDDQLRAHALASQAHQLAGRLLIQLRQVDLAHVALTAALDHARRSEDQVIGASAVAPMCWLLLRQGRFAEAERLAVTTADRIEPRMSTATPAELAAWGFLLIKGASAAVRDARDDDASELLEVASAGARRLGERINPHADVAGNDFSSEAVRLMQVECAVIAGKPDRALNLSEAVIRSPQVTPSSRQRHRLDVAWSRVQTGQYAEATDTLVELGNRAPAWLRQQRYAREIVSTITAERRRAMSRELADLASLVGCHA